MTKKKPPLLGTLFGQGRATVVGLPLSFDLLKELRRARRISLATAFAHASGWKLLAKAVRTSNASVRFVAGIDFCQTEPAVLTDWLGLATSRSGSCAYIGLGDAHVFHPKVLVVESASGSFAIVGSGNLSAGGLRDNTECSIFVRTPAVVAQVRRWFDDLCGDDAQLVALNESVIAEYAPRFEKARKAIQRVRAQQAQAERQIVETQALVLGRWKQAVSAAKRYFASPHFLKERQRRRGMARHICSLLHTPDFDFTPAEWREFYAILDYGHLIALNREGPLKRKTTLQAGLRHLLDPRVPEVDRLNSMLEPTGQFHVPRVGINVVSKVLATHDPTRWAVYNKPVAEVLKVFAAQPTKGVSRGERYLSFCLAMRGFRRETGAKTLLDLDLFFVHEYEW